MKMKDNIVGRIYETKDYNQFTILKTNRVLNEKHVKDLVKKMGTNGNLINIVVNEKKEVIEGQHRLEACRRLNIPIKYTIVPGLRIIHVIDINTASKNWNDMDYIKSYADDDREAYVFALDIINKYKVHPTTLLTVMAGNTNTTKLKDNMKNGRLSLKVEAEEVLNFADLVLQLKDITKFYDKQAFQMALYELYQRPGYNHNRLIKKLKKYGTNPKYQVKGSRNKTNYKIYIEDIFNAGRGKDNDVALLTREELREAV